MKRLHVVNVVGHLETSTIGDDALTGHFRRDPINCLLDLQTSWSKLFQTRALKRLGLFLSSSSMIAFKEKFYNVIGESMGTSRALARFFAREMDLACQGKIYVIYKLVFRC